MRDKLYYIFMFIFHHFRFDYAFVQHYRKHTNRTIFRTSNITQTTTINIILHTLVLSKLENSYRKTMAQTWNKHTENIIKKFNNKNKDRQQIYILQYYIHMRQAITDDHTINYKLGVLVYMKLYLSVLSIWYLAFGVWCVF